ncbi:nitrite and sulphite reductase 4Fe-4S region [Clostridium sp. CAG:628]|nr:nitrite and sulphite reductase 4Fe-4S region [Clostridium sp. CAG:628]
MDKIRNLPNYNTYSIELMNAVVKQDQNTINQIFNKIDEELRKIRKEKSITFERSQKMWNDPESHFRAVQLEEVTDLKMEFDDNLGLFQLANLVQYEPAMTITFTKMLKNLSDIRLRTNIRTARNEKMWNNPESHFKAVEAEKQADLENEITDLMSLYNIAQSANYTKGIELITNRLNKIAPNLADSLISKNSGTVHK